MTHLCVGIGVEHDELNQALGVHRQAQREHLAHGTHISSNMATLPPIFPTDKLSRSRTRREEPGVEL
jgi:hypothetical protein